MTYVTNDTVGTFEEFLSIFMRYGDKEVIFRGVKGERYELIPKIWPFSRMPHSFNPHQEKEIL